ncbi:DNA-binding protein [Amycolatopsis sp. VC5-11]|uniref:DNA-binding protein n=1 Tax=Amycolatopsis sp. VC5-11 TaxID=3120156 RepID=UPI00300A85B1
MARAVEPPQLDEIRTWGATTDIVSAGTVFGLGRTKSYELAQSDEFPVRVIRIGKAYRVVVADLIAFLEGADLLTAAPAEVA